MSIKTNKSYSKRLKITKNGKVLARASGQNHFNAKESRHRQLAAKRLRPFTLKNKTISQVLPNKF